MYQDVARDAYVYIHEYVYTQVYINMISLEHLKFPKFLQISLNIMSILPMFFLPVF